MNLRSCGAIAVFAAMAVCASTASAQETVGKGSLGATLGAPFFLADADTKEGQNSRLVGLANFQYVFTPKSRLAVTFGYGWVAYQDGTRAPYKVVGPSTPDSTILKDLMLTKYVPLALTYLRSFKDQGKGWVPYLGLGANLTRLEIVNDRDKIKDPATFESYVNWAPGVQVRGGSEYFLPSNKNVAFDLNAHWSYLFSKDEERFPSGFTGPHSYMSINFGVNVYFWPIGYKPIEVPKGPEAEAPAIAPTEPGLPPPPAPAPTPDPTPDPPPVPQSEPDTTKAPPAPQLKTSAATVVKPAAVKSVAAEAVTASEDTTAVSCPIPPTPGAAGSGSGMFGIPGSPPANGGAARTPQPDSSPEERPTP